MQKIILLTDYLERFSSKWAAMPYRSGMDKTRLIEYFSASGYDCEFLNFSELDFRGNSFSGVPVLYSTSEDTAGHYRDYIEDVLLGLACQGAFLIPRFELFRAHHNKVFMEILRDLMPINESQNIRTKHFGTLEDLFCKISEITFPCVVKRASGAGSSGVFKASSEKELIKCVKKISRTPYWFDEIWDFGRSLKHKGYIRESRHRNKYIVQTFIEGLTHDWKVLVFDDRFYVLRRSNRKNDFRASGSGMLEYRQDTPGEVLDLAQEIYRFLDVPNISIDVAYDGKQTYLLEFQCVGFGTHALDTSPFYFKRKNGNWRSVIEESILEKVYAESITNFVEKILKGKVRIDAGVSIFSERIGTI